MHSLYTVFYFATMLVIWYTYRRLFCAGNNNLAKYWKKTKLKYTKTIGRLAHTGSVFSPA